MFAAKFSCSQIENSNWVMDLLTDKFTKRNKPALLQKRLKEIMP